MFLEARFFPHTLRFLTPQPLYCSQIDPVMHGLKYLSTGGLTLKSVSIEDYARCEIVRTLILLFIHLLNQLESSVDQSHDS